MSIAANGWAEIKPHNYAGIRAGLKQLRTAGRGQPRTGQVLITYLPVDSSNSSVSSGQPACVRVFATRFEAKGAGDNPSDFLRKHAWYDLGSFAPPKQITLNVDDGGLFGAAIERYVRHQFQAVVKAPTQHVPGGGGPRQGPDVLWDELAELYAELARELEDPYYAELASELAAMARRAEWGAAA
jgi:hypothetical protein